MDAGSLPNQRLHQACSDALALAAGGMVDLVIIDINLPSGSGLDLIPLLRAVRPRARFLVCSLEDPKVFARAAREAGAAGYLQKGSRGDLILEVVGLILEGGEYFSDPGSG